MACPSGGFKLGFPCSKCGSHDWCREGALSSPDSEVRMRAVKTETEKTPYKWKSKPGRTDFGFWDAKKYNKPAPVKDVTEEYRS